MLIMGVSMEKEEEFIKVIELLEAVIESESSILLDVVDFFRCFDNSKISSSLNCNKNEFIVVAV